MIQENLSTNVIKEYDVVVAGGGIAGVSAAISSAREGSRVLLIENGYILGGLATAGLITYYLPLCDGNGRQVCFGLNEELLRLSIKHHTEKDCPQWLSEGTIEERIKKRFTVRYNPQLFALDLEKLLCESGVTILYGSRVCSVVKKENNIVSHVVVENVSGRVAYGAKAVVDATGDASLCVQAGIPTTTYPTKNILAGWYYYHCDKEYNLRELGPAEDPTNPFGKDQTLSDIRYIGVDAEEVSGMMLDSHRVMLSDILKHRKVDQSYIPVTMATVPQLRMTRRIVGEYTMQESELNQYIESSIGLIPDWRYANRVFELPYGSIYNKDFPNLYVAGRCISVGDTMWDVTRVIPGCVVTGQAAGTAASYYTGGKSVTDIAIVQDKLQKTGELLHL